MSREEDAIRATTRAIAAAVREVPPLVLEPAPGELHSPGRTARRGRPVRSGPRLRSWLAPVAAAAAVVAVAVSLVLIRGNQNEGAVPQLTPTVALAGGVPRYYVALDPVTVKGSGANGLLAGDAATGQTLARVKPPAHMSYASVTAAADDRTFLAFATATDGSWTSGRWYELRLAPGTAHPVSLTSTPIEPQSGVVGSALSASGSYLAMAQTGPSKGQRRVVVFSVATGHPLRAWSTTQAPATWAADSAQENLLTWIDGDRAIAFSAYDTAAGSQTVRTLSFPGHIGDGNLIADSQLIWATSASTPPDCRVSPPAVSADGRTIACAALSLKPLPAGLIRWTFSWRAYQASAQAPASGKYTTAYQVIQQIPPSSVALGDPLWVSPSGSALIGGWAVAPLPVMTPSRSSNGNDSSASTMLLLGPILSGADFHVGVMSHGTFTPLRLPPGINLIEPAIAW
jgi:hypothetical protein